LEPTTEPLRDSIFAAVLALLVAACGGGDGNGGSAGTAGGGGTAGDGGLPADAGLKPGANIDDCRSTSGTRVCGTALNCYVHGPDCDCIGSAGVDDRVRRHDPEVGFCGGVRGPVRDGFRQCGECLDGQVCLVWGALLDTPGSIGSPPVCVAEDDARVAWLNGLGPVFTYADGTPYDGRPIPDSETCPPPDGDLELCGGHCGGCSRPGFYCTGRSPTHPLGICYNGRDSERCEAMPGGRYLSIVAPGTYMPGAMTCVRDCERLAATVPGGAKCFGP
jgi:hypothetical protein